MCHPCPLFHLWMLRYCGFFFSYLKSWVVVLHLEQGQVYHTLQDHVPHAYKHARDHNPLKYIHIWMLIHAQFFPCPTLLPAPLWALINKSSVIFPLSASMRLCSDSHNCTLSTLSTFKYASIWLFIYIFKNDPFHIFSVYKIFLDTVHKLKGKHCVSITYCVWYWCRFSCSPTLNDCWKNRASLSATRLIICQRHLCTDLFLQCISPQLCHVISRGVCNCSSDPGLKMNESVIYAI